MFLLIIYLITFDLKISKALQVKSFKNEKKIHPSFDGYIY